MIKQTEGQEGGARGSIINLSSNDLAAHTARADAILMAAAAWNR